MDNRRNVKLNIVAYPSFEDLAKLDYRLATKTNCLVVKEGNEVVAGIITDEARTEIKHMVILTWYNGELESHLEWFIGLMNNNKNLIEPIEQYNTFDITYDYQPNAKLEAQGLMLTLAWKPSEKQQVVEMSKRLGDEVMATLEEIWTGRNYWNQHPVTIITDVATNKIVAYHCLAINSEKYPGKSKDYYSMVEPEYRGKGLSKAFIGNAFRMCNDSGYVNYITSCYNTGGGKMMFDALGIQPTETKENEFGGYDYKYEIDMTNVRGYSDLKAKYAK